MNRETKQIRIKSLQTVTNRSAPFIVVISNTVLYANSPEEALTQAKKVKTEYIVRTSDDTIFDKTMQYSKNENDFFNEWREFRSALNYSTEIENLHKLKNKYPQYFNSTELPGLSPVNVGQYTCKHLKDIILTKTNQHEFESKV